MHGNLLIVDDNVKLCKSLSQNFTQRGYQTWYVTNGRDAVKTLETQPVHVVLLDMMLGEEDGLETLAQLLALQKHAPIIMITGHASIDNAVHAIKIGAFDYVSKPVDFDELLNRVENALKLSQLNAENQYLKSRLNAVSPQIITRNAIMLKLCQKAEKLAATELPILLTGENGTGKEVIADFIHVHSARSPHAMQKINCAAFPETLLDNELFGHEKGAYTGAHASFKGVFERADHGSLFLDEIGDMPLTIQAKILRTLQNHEIRRLGGNVTLKVDVRFLAATNQNLAEMIQAGTFREDLFYRLNAAILELPPLRERREDIPLLAAHFLTEYAKHHAAPVKTLSPAMLTVMLEYHWPGNIRELKNTLNYAAAIAASDTLDRDDLPPQLTALGQPPDSTNIRADMEKTLILTTLQKVNYNKKKAADVLKMSRKTLYNKLEKYALDLPK